MGGEHDGREVALTELRNRLDDGLARAGLDKTQLAAQARLGRTTVHAAFQDGAPAPSAKTVAALARLPVDKLLELRRTAAGEGIAVHAAQEGPGKPIGEWDPHDLEVHPAGTATTTAVGSGARSHRALPGYVPRAHDRVLGEAVRTAREGRSQMLVLVGSSSTGKTRACWEAVQQLAAAGWGLWHPYDPTRAEAALVDLGRVAPRTVVWLNEAQHYFGHPQAGERIAAALHTLLTHPDRQPVLILGTLWPEYADSFTVLPRPDEPDPHSRAREVLTGRTLTIPDTFDKEALHAATTLAQGGDRLMADALTRAHTHGRVTQDLAGAPALLRRYEHGTPPARALLEAAMDARRLGVGLHLPQAFLIDAAADYLTDHDYDQLTEDWAEAAFADLARLVHGKQAPLRRTTSRPPRRPPGVPAPAMTPVPVVGPVFRLADYLEQHGRTLRPGICPPASFWHAAYTHLTDPDDLGNLAVAADRRHRLQWADYLRRRAADAVNPDALSQLAWKRARARDFEGAEALYRFLRRAADAGHPGAPASLARLRQKAGDWESADTLYALYRAADAGHPAALVLRALRQENADDQEDTETLARPAANARFSEALYFMERLREEAEDQENTEVIYRQAADAGQPAFHLQYETRWPYGLDPDGSPTPPWD